MTSALISGMIAPAMVCQQIVARGTSYPGSGAAFSIQVLPTDPTGSAVLTLQGLPVGADIFVLAAGTTTVLLQVDAHPATSYAYAYSLYSAATVVDIGFVLAGYVPYYIRSLTLPRVNSVLPVALTPDRNFV